MEKTVIATQKQRADIGTNWTIKNPILQKGEIGVVIDTNPMKVKIGNGTSTWNSLGFINEINSTIVTTALGYTPYNATNPNGYISTVTKAMIEAALTGIISSHTHSYEPIISSGTTAQYLRGDKTWQLLPTSLPASDVYSWAKAPTKPTYTNSEISNTLGTVESVQSLPINLDVIVATLNSSQSLGYSGTPNEGWSQSVFIRNTTSNSITISVPYTGSYVSFVTNNSFSIGPWSGQAELKVIYTGGKFNIILSTRRIGDS